MRPAYLTPKLTDANRLEIRRLRSENPKAWTLGKLARKFCVHRSTISHVLRKRMRISAEQEMAAARSAIETSGQVQADELMRLKHQEWSRQLLSERDLGRQQQLLNLIKGVTPLLAPAKNHERQYRPCSEEDRSRAVRALQRHRESRGMGEEELGVALMRGNGTDGGSKPAMPPSALDAASVS